MPWSTLANNQTVSFTNLKDAVNTGVFTQKVTIPTSNEQITKADAAYYVNINTSYAPYAAKASNQLVVKSNLQACTNLPYSYTLYYDVSDGNYYGFTSSGLACGASTNALTVYSNSSSLSVGATLYTDPCGYNQLYASSYNTSTPFFKYGSSYITFENWDGTNTGYQVRAVTACVTSYGWLFNGGGAGFTTSAAALATFTGGPYRYSNINGMVSNVTTFYADSGLVYPFNGGNLWYCCQLNGTGTRYAAYINGSGVVTTYTT
jgi:hypothetical protein